MNEMTLHGRLFLGPYQGYHGEASFDPEDECFSGRVVDTKDIITFEGDTPRELKQAFVESIDDYLEFCKERGDAPEKRLCTRSVARMRLAPKKRGCT